MAAVFKGLYLAAARSQARSPLPIVGSYRVRTVDTVFLGRGWRKHPQATLSLPAVPRLLLLPAPVPARVPVSLSATIDSLLGSLDWDDEFEQLAEAQQDPPADTTASTGTSSAAEPATPAPTASPSPQAPGRVLHHYNFLGEPVYNPTSNSPEDTTWAMNLAQEHVWYGLAPLAHHGRPNFRIELLKYLARNTIGYWSIHDYQAALEEMAQQQHQQTHQPMPQQHP
ncbi:MAG: hypothetical protein M1816_005764 [Peltula sp. TS41687]|nr:MAG: hypothetical protein M1816_005764 [Peltula sp. TS41687]